MKPAPESTDRHAKMDLQVYVIIPVVFLVSFLSYLFISKYLPHGKSFDEMIAEKKRLREEVLGPTRNAAKHDKSSKKKPKKDVKKRDAVKPIKEKEVSEHESESSDDSEIIEEPLTPSEALVMRKNAQKPHAAPQQAKKANKNNNNKPQPVAVSKSEPIVVAKPAPVEEVVQPVEEPKPVVEAPRPAPEEKKTKKTKPVKETPPVSPKNQPIAAPAKPAVVEEKPAKKKRSEASTSAVDGFVAADDITPLIREITKADLTKNQIQVLIDFLLNKQADTRVADPLEWSEGKSDLVQKLKRQLQETEAKWRNEQDALRGMQNKLKELRAELNSEKIQSNATIKSISEQMHACKLDLKGLQAELQNVNEKHTQEKQTLKVSYQQLHAKFAQMQESLKAQEELPNIQQLQSDNQLLHQELAKKQQHIMELNANVDESRQKEEQLKKLLSENDKKIAERELSLRKSDDRLAIIEKELRQKVQDLTLRDADVKELNVDATRAKELDKVVQRQTSELEQLKKQLSEQQQSKHGAEENSKIEIRNLQNALDSSKKESEAQHANVAEFKKQIEDLRKQLAESQQLTKAANATSGDSFLLNEKINELNANHQNIISQKETQIADLKKQIDALQKTESDLAKQIDEQKTKNNNHTNNSELSHIKDLFAKHFPDVSSSSITTTADDEWLDSVLEHLKSQIVSNKSSTNAISVTNNHQNSNCSDNFNNKPMNGDSSNSNNTSSSSDNEKVLKQNAQLKSSVEEYKKIIADTESMLKNLETKVREQDQYWSKVVLMKDNEIDVLKGTVASS